MQPIRQPSFVTLLLLVSFGSIGALLVTPALPDIAAYFSVSDRQSQFMVSLYLVGYAAGQLLYGPLSHRMGRKNAIYLGVIIEICAALLCYISAWINAWELLMIARLLMAVGASVGLMMTFTIIAESYKPARATKLISLLSLGFAIMPGIAIGVGGIITQYMGWESCFLLLALYGVLLLFLCSFLPAAPQELDKNALQISTILQNYLKVLKDENLLIYAFITGLSTSIIYIFAQSSPFLAIQILNSTPYQFGFWQLIPSIGMVIGSCLSAFLAHAWRSTRTIKVGIVIIMFGILLMLASFVTNLFSIVFLFVPMLIINIGLALIFANASASGTERSVDKSNASSVLSFVNMGTAVLSTYLVSFINLQFIFLIPIIFLVISMLMLFLSAMVADEGLKIKHFANN